MSKEVEQAAKTGLISSTNYSVVDVKDELPERGTRCFVYTKDNRGQSYYKRATMFESGAWVIDDESDGTVTHWLKPVPDSILITREDIVKMLGDAFDAGGEHEYRKHLGSGANQAPDKQQYINQLIKGE